MSETADIAYLKPFLEATMASAARFRRVLLVVIVSSVLAFGAFWNARKGSWLNSRITVVRTAEAYLASKEIGEELIKREQQLNESALVAASAATSKQAGANSDREKLAAELGKLRHRKAELDESLRNRDVSAAREWIELAGIKRSEQLTLYAQQLENARVNYVVLFHIPFFGSVFDVNELGLLAGFTFVVVLMWFRFSLWREYYNLSATFRAARTKEDLESCYKYLEMSQVLTVPPTLTMYQPRERPWGKVVRTLYLLPVAVQLAVVSYDCYSFDLGWVVSKFNTLVSVTASFCFLVLSSLLTFWCFRLSGEIDKEWEKAARRIDSTIVLPSKTNPSNSWGVEAVRNS